MNIDTNGFHLGDIVRDPYYNVEGPIIGFTQWQTGCARATIVRGYGPDGKLLDNHGADVLLIEIVKFADEHNVVDATKGGPMPEPPTQR